MKRKEFPSLCREEKEQNKLLFLLTYKPITNRIENY